MRGATEATAGASPAPEGRRKERLDRGLKVRTEGLYAVNSFREMGYLVGPRLLLVLGLALLPVVLPNLYWQRVLCVAGAYALLAVSFDFLANYVGLVCVGGAFMTGIGGYTAGIFTYYLNVPWPISILLGTVSGCGTGDSAVAALVAAARNLLRHTHVHVSVLGPRSDPGSRHTRGD